MKQTKKPKKNSNKPIADLVLKDIKSRKAFGKKKYGMYLQAFNGRNGLQDLYEELIDAVLYCRQMLEEQNKIVRDIVTEQKVKYKKKLSKIERALT